MIDVIVWTGWIGGIAIGLYVLVQHWITNKPLGCSLSYGNLVGFLSALSYFRTGEFKKLVNWRLWFLIGIPLGGLVASLTTPNMDWSFTLSMGTTYEKVMPDNDFLKAMVVTLGGILMGLGARMAGGCTSGHVIVGCGLLNLPSILAGFLFFIGGLGVVQLLFNIFV